MHALTQLSLRAKLTKDLAAVTCPMQPLLLSLKGFRSNLGLQQPKKSFPLAPATHPPPVADGSEYFVAYAHTHKPS